MPAHSSYRATRSLRAPGAAIALLLGLCACQAQAAALTLADALRLAQDRSRQLVAQDAATSSARELAVAARQQPDPTVRASLDALPVNGPDRLSVVRDNFTMRTIGITQEWVRADKRGARAARYEREAEAAQATRAMALANLQRDTAIAWLNRHYQERMRDLLMAQRDETRLQADAAIAAYRGGRGSQADVFAARTAIASIEDRIDQSNAQVAASMTQLARWVGDAATQALAESPSTDTVGLGDDDLEARFEHHPEIAVMARRQDVAQADADLANANRRADWTVGLTYARRGPSFSDFVFFSVSIPLQWDPSSRQDRELAAKLATVEQLRAEREEATRGHVADTVQMLHEWQTDRRRLERFDTSLLPLAGERVGAALAAYRGGSASLAAVLEARRGELDTRIERARLALETDRLWAQLRYLIPAGHDAAARR